MMSVKSRTVRAWGAGMIAVAISLASLAATVETKAPAADARPQQDPKGSLIRSETKAPALAARPQPALAKPQPAAAPKASSENQIEVLIAQAMDQKTSLDVKELPIREALAKLSEKTGIPIEMEIHTVWLLPYGSQTLLTATIKDRPLRESLTAMIRPLGLQFEILKDRVAVQPTPALRRLARRATWEELATLEMLYSKPWNNELFESLKFQFQDSTADDLNVNRETLRKLTGAVGAGTAATVLEHATDQYGWTWYPAADHIVILSKTKQVERQLERRVKVKYEGASLRDVLLDLTNWAGVPLRMDPAVLAVLPSHLTERFSLSMENATVRQALEVVAGETGIGYFIEPNGIRITSSTPPSSTGGSTSDVQRNVDATVAALRSNSIVGQLTIPNADGTSFAFFLRESDLPSDVNELRKARVRAAAEIIRKALVPTSQPES